MAAEQSFWDLDSDATVVANVPDVEGDICGDATILKTIKTKGQDVSSP
jgi:hypothetical protein